MELAMETFGAVASRSLIGEEKKIFLKRKDTILRGKKGTIILTTDRKSVV